MIYCYVRLQQVFTTFSPFLCRSVWNFINTSWLWIETLDASTKQLPIEYLSKGKVISDRILRHAFIISTSRQVLLEDGETAEVVCNDILSITWDRQVWLTHLTEDAVSDHLFDNIQQVVLCEHQDRGMIHNPMNIQNFYIFIQGGKQIVSKYCFWLWSMWTLLSLLSLWSLWSLWSLCTLL